MAVAFEGIIGTGTTSAITTADIPEPSGGVGHMLVPIATLTGRNNPAIGTNFYVHEVFYPSQEYACKPAFGPGLGALGVGGGVYVGESVEQAAVTTVWFVRPIMAPTAVWAFVPSGTEIFLTEDIAGGFVSAQMALALFSGVNLDSVIASGGIVALDTPTFSLQELLFLIWVTQAPGLAPSTLTEYAGWFDSATVTQPLGAADTFVGAVGRAGVAGPNPGAVWSDGGPGFYPDGYAIDVPSPSWALTTFHEFTGSIFARRILDPAGNEVDIAIPWRFSFGYGATSDTSFTFWPVGSLGFVEGGPSFFQNVYEYQVVTSRNFSIPRGFGLISGGVDKCPIAPPNIQRRHRAAQ